MFYEKITYDKTYIRIQHNQTCYCFDYTGQLQRTEDIFGVGSLVEIDAMSLLVMMDKIEVASHIGVNFSQRGIYKKEQFEALDIAMRQTLGFKYRLIRHVDNGTVQYLYIYQKGILTM